jgi:hypothetical protein
MRSTGDCLDEHRYLQYPGFESNFLVENDLRDRIDSSRIGFIIAV